VRWGSKVEAVDAAGDGYVVTVNHMGIVDKAKASDKMG
jgi:hypothetical protein